MVLKTNNNSNYSILKKCLFGAVSLTKNADINMYNYFGYGIGFDGHGSYSHPSGGNGKNEIIFGVDVSSSTKSDNRKKGYFDFGFRSYTRIRRHTWCRKNLFN